MKAAGASAPQRFRKHMARETEIKLRIKDLRALRRALQRLGARLVSNRAWRVHEWNVLFDTPHRALRRREELLRIRTETARQQTGKGRSRESQRVILTFKRPVRSAKAKAPGSRWHKVREEIELQVTDAKALAEIFEAFGMRVWFRYEKYRTTFRLPERQRWARGLLIELDETPLGEFIELEGPVRAIDRAAKALTYSRRDYISANYFVLYREECRRKGQQPGDMVFASSRPATRGV